MTQPTHDRDATAQNGAEVADRASSPTDEASSVSTNVKEQAADVATNAKEHASEVASDAKERGSSVAADAAEQASAAVDAGREQVATGIEGAAEQLRSAAPDSGAAASVASTAADTLEDTAGYLRSRSSDEVVGDIESFVRTHPAQGIAAAVVAGFVIARIIR